MGATLDLSFGLALDFGGGAEAFASDPVVRFLSISAMIEILSCADKSPGNTMIGQSPACTAATAFVSRSAVSTNLQSSSTSCRMRSRVARADPLSQRVVDRYRVKNADR